MTNYYKTIIVSSLLPLVLGATSLPQASSKPVVNLQSYLKYNLEAKINFKCQQKATLYICESDEQSITETDENNVTVTVSFKKMQVYFSSKLSPQLKKESFEKTMQEIQESEAALEKASQNNNPMPIQTPLEDILNRALFGNLTHISLDNLDITNSEPKSHITVKNVTYDNTMQAKIKGVSFEERVFGKIQLRYTQALIDSNNSESFSQNIPAMLEEWSETHNEKRANYVDKKLHELYGNEALSPIDGMISLDSKYIGNDSIALEIKSSNDNHKNSSGSFDFSGELHQISTLFQPSKGVQNAGMPDFLFKNLKLHSYNKADTYRHLINNDKKLSTYVGEYTKLIHTHFDKKVQAFTSRCNYIFIEYREIAEEMGFINYKVCKCPNDHPLFVSALKDIYEKMR